MSSRTRLGLAFLIGSIFGILANFIPTFPAVTAWINSNMLLVIVLLAVTFTLGLYLTITGQTGLGRLFDYQRKRLEQVLREATNVNIEVIELVNRLGETLTTAHLQWSEAKDQQRVDYREYVQGSIKHLGDSIEYYGESLSLVNTRYQKNLQEADGMFQFILSIQEATPTNIERRLITSDLREINRVRANILSTRMHIQQYVNQIEALPLVNSLGMPITKFIQGVQRFVNNPRDLEALLERLEYVLQKTLLS